MGIRVGKSYAALVTAMRQMIAGLLQAKDDPIQAEFAKQLTELLEGMLKDDEEQEKTKALLYAITERFSEKQNRSREVIAKSISYLEAIHGKTGAGLQTYGISRRQSTARKTRKKNPDKP